jgi:hypothetical protein
MPIKNELMSSLNFSSIEYAYVPSTGARSSLAKPSAIPGHDRMVVGFATTYAIGAYHH